MSIIEPFSSRDFWRVPPSLSVRMPDRLIHRTVANVDDHGSRRFSSERNHAVQIADLPSSCISMTIGGLSAGQSTRRHRHNYETLIYIVEGYGRTTIEDQRVEWRPGDVVYIPVWAWHCHENRNASSSCLYVACENAPMLQNLGIALREEEPEKQQE